MYCAMHGSSCDITSNALNISAQYLDANEPVVKEQLQKASVRLARLLDTAFLNQERIENRSDSSRPALPVGLSDAITSAEQAVVPRRRHAATLTARRPEAGPAWEP